MVAGSCRLHTKVYAESASTQKKYVALGNDGSFLYASVHQFMLRDSSVDFVDKLQRVTKYMYRLKQACMHTQASQSDTRQKTRLYLYRIMHTCVP